MTMGLEDKPQVPLVAQSSDMPPPGPHFVYEPSCGWVALDLKKIWLYRELLYFLAWRDIKVRYKQTVLGVTWAILQPIMTMIVFSIFFGYLSQMSSDGVPYPIFTYAALLPWQLFAQALNASANSLVFNKQLITKVYFPRLIMPFSSVSVGLVDFCLSFIVLLGLMYYYGISPTVAIIVLPLFILLTIITALAVGLWLAALNVQYRDVQHTIPFLTQFWLFATPIVYCSSIVPEPWRNLYALNPMVGVVNGFRWALLGQSTPLDTTFVISLVVICLLLISSLIYFKRMERTFADVV
jgi:lipopolysaccharide transport system permease protein